MFDEGREQKSHKNQLIRNRLSRWPRCGRLDRSGWPPASHSERDRPGRGKSNNRLVSLHRGFDGLQLAQGQGHRRARRTRLRPLHARPCRHPLSRCRAHSRRPRQSADPLARRALPGLAAIRGAAHPQAAGVLLHAQARQLAQHGQDRDRRPARPMPRPSYRKPRPPVAEIAAWEHQRNQSRAHINWMFSTEQTRIKLAKAYPKATAKES